MTKENTVNVETFPMCPVDFAFRRIGGKYKGRILWMIYNNNVLRYGELKKMLENATTKMLTQTLRELEADALIHRKVYHVVPPKVEYRLTETGTELIPFIQHINAWGRKQLENLARKKSVKKQYAKKVR